MNRDILDRAMELANQAWHEENLSCREAEWDGACSTLRLYLEDGAIPECVKGSKLLMDSTPGDAIDGLMPTGYTLEVSSPGVERPLRRIHHFQGAIDQKIALQFEEAGTRVELIAVLLGASEKEGLTIEGDSDESRKTIALSKIVKARLLVDWNAIQPSKAGENEE